MRPLHDPAVLAGDAHGVAVALDAARARALEQRDALAHELVLERRRHLGVLEWEHLLARDEQRHLRAEGVEHVRELDSRDPRADHHYVLGQLGRRVRLAGGEHPLPVHRCELGNPGARPRGDHDEVGFELLDAAGGLDHHFVRPLEPPCAAEEPDLLRLQQLDDRLVQALLDRRDPLAQRVQVDAALGLQAHHVAAGELGQLAAGGDHRLGGDAVPQVGRAGDDVALDERHLRAQCGRDRRARVAGRAAAEDREPYSGDARHAPRLRHASSLGLHV